MNHLLLSFAAGFVVGGPLAALASHVIGWREEAKRLVVSLADAESMLRATQLSLNSTFAELTETKRVLANVVAGIGAPADDPSMTPAEREALRAARELVARQAQK